jgi:hypothetical protein
MAEATYIELTYMSTSHKQYFRKLDHLRIINEVCTIMKRASLQEQYTNLLKIAYGYARSDPRIELHTFLFAQRLNFKSCATLL